MLIKPGQYTGNYKLAQTDLIIRKTVCCHAENATRSFCSDSMDLFGRSLTMNYLQLAENFAAA